jgi:biotin-dependent carboxylase-like uncharacterized protein
MTAAPSAVDAVVASEPALRIVQVGFATTVQDRGRPGLAHLGVPTAGAVDRRTHDLMNRLVGNPPDAATIETMGSLVVEALRPVVIATSTDASRQTLSTGARVRVDAPPGSVWAYLAVRGGVGVEPVLGSRSHDTLGGVGPPALANDAVIAVGPDPLTALSADHAPQRRPSDGRVRIWDGPQHDWFIGGIQGLIGRAWRVTSELSRVGVRLEAGDFARTTRSQPQMGSVGITSGAVQITPAGEPIVMLANHPTTGGYPVIAVVDPDDLSDLVQTRPGSTVHFRRA